MSMSLTPKQAETLEFIRSYGETHRCGPNFDEMMAALDLNSKSSVHRLLSALEERGHIRRLPNRARAIEIVDPVSEPDMFMYLNRMEGAERRRLIAIAAGLEAAEDRDGGREAALMLRRIADRLTGAPRQAAA